MALLYLLGTAILATVLPVQGYHWSEAELDWNLNQNESAIHPLEYWGEWENHTFNKSPKNWRFPFYMLTIDRYVDGDPSNNDANGTVFENDWMSNQFRFGGDAKGLMDNLDYIEDSGMRAIYLSGSPFLNQPWASDGFGPLDFTVLDHHHGRIQDWRDLVTEIHRRGMYLILDNTVGTMGDLLAFKGYENVTTPFAFEEHDALWKSDKRYWDFDFGNDFNESCEYPVFWDDTGYPYTTNVTDHFHGCRISDFDQYGDMKGVGYVPPYQTQLSKFASVQDRLRLWKPSVLEKVKHFSCMQIAMLDIDGFRVDKALQTPLKELADWASYQRECALRYGKDNFLITGEAVGQLNFSSTFYGRGKMPHQYFENITEAQLATNNTEKYIRETGKSALDGAAFHYPTYGAMSRFLGLDGDIGFEGVDFAEHWNKYLSTDDMVNPETGEFDPRHMYGMTNQDVFRWPSLVNGTQRHTLGFLITMLEMPGIPMIEWGEEQEYKVLENLAADYIFGRQPMAATRAWQLHGCYKVGAAGNGYYDMPFGPALDACHDDNVSLDQRDPSSPLRNLLRRMFELRNVYPTLNDGFTVRSLFFDTEDTFLPHSGQLPTPYGIWSLYRGRTLDVQDFDGQAQGNQGVWIIYQNQNHTVKYAYDCKNSSHSLIAPFPQGTTIKNLFYPYEEITLGSSTTKLGIENSDEINGCLPSIELEAYGYRAFVPKNKFVLPAPQITKSIPRHDARIKTAVGIDEEDTVSVELEFSREMNCDSVTKSITTSSKTYTGAMPRIDESGVVCKNITPSEPRFVGQIMSQFSWKAKFLNVSHGVHSFTVRNASAADGSYTNSRDRFMFRMGALDNPIVWTHSANYTTNLLHRDDLTGELYVTPKAIGADKWRYSTNWGSSYSKWMPYKNEKTRIEMLPWSGTEAQQWDGIHITTQYWSQLTGSTHVVQHSDLDFDDMRRFPHLHVQGPWNEYGFDGGLDDSMSLKNGTWSFDLVSEWPTQVILNVWGMNPDGKPDKSSAFGDVDGDRVLDWVPPDSLAYNEVNITDEPAWPHLAYRISVNDGNYGYSLTPVGSGRRQIVLYVLLALTCPLCAIAAACAFAWAFYRLKLNTFGLSKRNYPFDQFAKEKKTFPSLPFLKSQDLEKAKGKEICEPENMLTQASSGTGRTILIATMEYEIEDWAIKIKIGGLGVMASLMGKNLSHQNLIWVIPCVGDVKYPVDTPGEPMIITVMGKPFTVSVQYHKVNNITYVLLDAPVFRQQTKAEPYPARMDDMDSAIYYSAWNACIAETMKRFPEIDLYHINDYHGAVAPLHLLPQVIPCCLSLHNAEFQGLWSINTPDRLSEISSVFNLDEGIVKKYVQWGEVFNLLHAGASYLRIHQKGFGAAGVSKKYGKRSFSRYPIFWGLQKVGALPNPDPTDTGEWDRKLPDPNVTIDEAYEESRGELRKQAQEWAGLNVDPTAELFVFVGRWSKQKGIDLIGDVFPSILESKPKTQLICVGPVIDLYGKFAALKLDRLMQLYPGRVYSKPEFTALPPYIFSGAEFALIPSRDEPFGLVSVEFGRKGALGVGARVGGLGQMPGWWFTIESVSTKHLITQFKGAIKGALASDTKTRALMRARSGVQRFPVVQWVKDLEKLQTRSIKLHQKVQSGDTSTLNSPMSSMPGTALNSPWPSIPGTAINSPIPSMPSTAIHSPAVTSPNSRSNSPVRSVGLAHSASLSRRLRQLGMTPAREPVPAVRSRQHSISSPSGSNTPPSPHTGATASNLATPSVLSVNHVVGDNKDYNLQEVDPSFTDVNGTYYRKFEQMLIDLNPKNSEDKLCVEEFLAKSEKHWFGRFHSAKLGRTKDASMASLQALDPEPWRLWKGTEKVHHNDSESGSSTNNDMVDDGTAQFMLSDQYSPPTGAAKLLLLKVGDWPVYSILLALGQIIASNSYQITLITGTVGQAATKLYVVASIYLAGSIFWWALFRCVPSRYVLSLPFLGYGIAFFLVGMAPYGSTIDSRGWIQNVATGFYALASSSGSIFFAQNFGSEAGAAVRSWVFRACTIQGTQQIYVTVLWYWGSYLTRASSQGKTAEAMFTYTHYITAVMTPVAILLWFVGALLYFGLPEYYRASPGFVPSFYRSIAKRRIVLWFFFTVLIQNYWLSAPYGRNWLYLWNTIAVSPWVIVLLVVVFFVGVWSGMLWTIARISARHSWFLPICAIGLGAPRWCQMLWGVSGVGAYMPWGSAAGGAIAGRALWLWLGVLDSIQGVGLGMILLQTLTRFHVTFTLMAAQVLGSIATIAARASAPDNTGPGTVFPNFGLSLDGLGYRWFWVCLGFQLIIPVGFFMFFRKEQISKP